MKNGRVIEQKKVFSHLKLLAAMVGIPLRP